MEIKKEAREGLREEGREEKNGFDSIRWAEAGAWSDSPGYTVNCISACLKSKEKKIYKQKTHTQKKKKKPFTTESMNHSRSTHKPFMLEKLSVPSSFSAPSHTLAPDHVGGIELAEFPEDSSVP